MQLVVLGLNHKTAPVGIRECFSFSEEQVRIALRHINKSDDIHEGVILSTCNRTEIYAVVDDPEDALAVLLDFFLIYLLIQIKQRNISFTIVERHVLNIFFE